MPLSLLSSVEVGEVTEAWLEACLLMLLPSTPAGGCSVEHGEVLLLARLEEGEILCGKDKTQGRPWDVEGLWKHNRSAERACGSTANQQPAAGYHLSFHYQSVYPALKVTGVAWDDASCLGVRVGSLFASYFEAGRTKARWENMQTPHKETRLGIKLPTLSNRVLS